MSIAQAIFPFLKDLDQNNNREWFESNKGLYEHALSDMKEFHKRVETKLAAHDLVGKSRVYRIYRDVRFSKDKTPYKNNWGGGFQRATHYLRGGYYYQIQPGNSFAAGGFFSPNPQDLIHIRRQIQQDPEALRDILNQSAFKKHFGCLMGEQVKTAPKNFSIDDPAIDLLRFKQFYVEKHFTDSEVLSVDFSGMISDTFAQMRPYFDYMSEVLTTDLNGESLVDLK